MLGTGRGSRPGLGHVLIRDVRVVDFDDVDTSVSDPATFASDRYQREKGIVIRGTDGQYASRSFGYPTEFKPTSSPNMYAPGPPATARSAPPRGGHTTDVTFTVDGERAGVAGFGVIFIDADYPSTDPSVLHLYDAEDRLIAQTAPCYGPNRAQLFRGVIAWYPGGSPAPVIYRVQVTNGNEWPSVNVGEGVPLDDFALSLPAVDRGGPAPKRRRGHRNSRTPRWGRVASVLFLSGGRAVRSPWG